MTPPPRVYCGGTKQVAYTSAPTCNVQATALSCRRILPPHNLW